MSTSTKTMKTIKYLGLFFWNVLSARGDQSDQNCRNLWARTYGPEEIQTKRPCFSQPFSLLLSYNSGHWDRTDLVPSPPPFPPNQCWKWVFDALQHYQHWFGGKGACLINLCPWAYRSKRTQLKWFSSCFYNRRAMYDIL